MKRIHLAAFSNTVAFVAIGLYFDKVTSYFGVTSTIANTIIIAALIFAIIPFVFMKDVYETYYKSKRRWSRGSWFWKSSGTSISTQLTVYTVVRLFGIIPISSPVILKQISSDEIQSDSELDYGRIRTFVDFIASLVPVLSGWFAQPSSKGS